jgi:hypothetical protein
MTLMNLLASRLLSLLPDSHNPSRQSLVFQGRVVGQDQPRDQLESMMGQEGDTAIED